MLFPYMILQCNFIGAHQLTLFARLRSSRMDLFVIIDTAFRSKPFATVFALLGPRQFHIVVLVR